MPTYPHIDSYYEQLRELIEFGGATNEENIRLAFLNCLSDYCKEHSERFVLVPELRSDRSNKPDGTVRDSLRMTRGLWEAKDTHDDLDREIRNKLGQGYSGDNILFENSATAVLVQGNQEVLRTDMANAAALDELIRRFLDYELPEIQEFREARQQFKYDLPTVLESLRETIVDAEASNPSYQESARIFLELCHQSISPKVTNDNVREMLIQHILTKDIFLRVFGEDQFHRENNVARQLDALEGTFFTGNVRRQAVDRLRAYYGAIGRAADDIAEYSEKQQFLKGIYEDFYQAYNPGAADRLGVVYTPNEVVDFIIRGTDWLLQKHFGKTLGDKKVNILDPATGTGTFITNLMSHLPVERLEYKYQNEIHANEVEILPYYIANLNIEYTFKELTGNYSGFPNLCFVDTLDNMNWKGASGATVQRQTTMNLGGVSEENWIRIQEQNEKPISIIIGNPPYNDQQSNWYDDNPNRKYPEIDKRIRETYVKESVAQRTHQYDMYKRFIRWASDRLEDDGIIGFITNRAYLDTRQDDGFRRMAEREFTDIYVMDLGSDVRRNPKISGTTHNVFGIQTGVAIGFFVREKAKLGNCGVHYARREDEELSADKLAFLHNVTIEGIGFDPIVPDAKSNWLNQSTSNFDQLVPVADRQTKLAKSISDERAIFGLYSAGVNTSRDEWVYDFGEEHLVDKAQFFCNVYQKEALRYVREVPAAGTLGSWVDKSIKWTSELTDHLARGSSLTFSSENLITGLYRPFTIKYTYYAPIISHRRYQLPHVFPTGSKNENQVICFPGNFGGNEFRVLATDRVLSYDLLKTTQCLPLYRYTTEGDQVSNITEWGLRQFRDHYGDDAITAEDIFAYVYAMLHDPAYRERYEIDLRREFPRVYFQDDFAWWAQQGQELLDLHIGFETAEPWPLERLDQDGVTPKRAILRADKDSGIITLDEQTTLTGVPAEAWEYRLGSRSALEWILDQYKEKKIKDPTIREQFNTYRFADHKERVVDLLGRVCAVSAFTTTIVKELGTRSSIEQT